MHEAAKNKPHPALERQYAVEEMEHLLGDARRALLVLLVLCGRGDSMDSDLASEPLGELCGAILGLSAEVQGLRSSLPTWKGVIH